MGEAFWLAVRGNLATLADAATWAEVVRGPIEPKIEGADFLALTARETGPEMARLLPLIGRAQAEARLKGQPA